ncbi:MAG: hypothetical protein A2365_03410 [Candidatus Nealsonbacteria bacterium RIFOXYB1_FULL_40_15]|uniref:Uncharacterized protein n=2 Tax=Candidatus Nealsoniibacteriota TaxID=1817911 RepID=A0A1G2ERE9_9BACT|nr:MAG: hypothetical protein A2365_03410 [Candidatus Nealsonbacteria bacterium RIFOXYB1_FULL_40_15]OGZ28353.1 MAG: hypothetical protein A2427_01090 [Candidatus Nealsonbacteria bacterium RIFOXYC1_FULL_40_7]OGZ29478.1 MAG: hypothetical protein A2562_02185 [Candidatus Nealsonbacteria bacterium RIFOXYD1_FULL_39_11]
MTGCSVQVWTVNDGSANTPIIIGARRDILLSHNAIAQGRVVHGNDRLQPVYNWPDDLDPSEMMDQEIRQTLIRIGFWDSVYGGTIERVERV